jgi:protein phosphatase
MKILSFGATDPGKKRANNEDAYLVNDVLGLYAVADGVGGSEAGEVASRIAVDTIAGAMPDLLATGTDPAFGVRSRTCRACRVPPCGPACEREHPRGGGIPSRPDRHGNDADSALPGAKAGVPRAHRRQPAYRLRGGTLAQLTSDHSVVAEQVRSGILTPAQARTSPYRHVITRALGIDREAVPDLMEQPLKPGDMFLLCSDGLTEMVDDDGIGRILAGSAPRDAAQKLIDAANERGGVDNITAVVVQVVEI